MRVDRLAILLIGLVLFAAHAFALQVAANPSPITATVTKASPQVTFTASVTLETNDDAVAVSVISATPGIGISGPTYITASGTYQYTLLFPSTPGTYTGTVVFKATGSSGAEYQVSFNVAVTAWESKLKDFFETGVMYKINVGTESYLLKIKDQTDSTITLYFDGATYTIAKGDSEIVKENLKIQVVDIYSSGAVLEFFTDGDPVTAAKYSESTGTSVGTTLAPDDLSGFHFLISKYSKYIQQGMTYTVTVTLVNDTDYRVYMKDIYFENTTVTPDGEKPTRLEDYQMPSYLDPGQELTLKVTVDTRGLDVGKTYTPSLIALGRIGEQDVKAQVDFYITVVKAVQTGEQQTTSNAESSTSSSANNTSTTTPKTMVIQIVPENPQPGDTVTIYVRDAKTNDYVNAEISVNGEKKSTFTADWCQMYRITATAQGYVTTTKTVNIKCRNLNLTYDPQNPEEGDIVNFTVTDADTGQPVTAQIKVDGKPIVGTSWTAVAGTHTVMATAEGYSPKSVVIRVREKPVTVLSQIPTSLQVNQEVNITLSREASWEIYDQNGVLVASGKSSVIRFSPPDGGAYTIKVDGKELAQISVEKPKTFGGFSGFSGNTIWILAGVGLLLVIYDSWRKRKGGAAPAKKPTPATVGFDLRPKPRIAMPTGGEGENQ